MPGKRLRAAVLMTACLRPALPALDITGATAHFELMPLKYEMLHAPCCSLHITVRCLASSLMQATQQHNSRRIELVKYVISNNRDGTWVAGTAALTLACILDLDECQHSVPQPSIISTQQCQSMVISTGDVDRKQTLQLLYDASASHPIY